MSVNRQEEEKPDVGEKDDEKMKENFSCDVFAQVEPSIDDYHDELNDEEE